MSVSTTLYISIVEGTAGEANQLANRLLRWLESSEVDVEVSRIKTDNTSMDGGITVAAILAAPAVVELAKALGQFLLRYQNSKITIKTADGEIVGENLTQATIQSALAAKFR
jgi:hypothetical protein